MNPRLFFHTLLLVTASLNSCSYEEETPQLTPAQLRNLEKSDLTSFNFYTVNDLGYFNTKYMGINSTFLLAKNGCLITSNDTIEPLFQYKESQKNWWTDFLSGNTDTLLGSDSLVWTCNPSIVKRAISLYQTIDSLKINKITSIRIPKETEVVLQSGETYLFSPDGLNRPNKEDWKICAPKWFILQDYKSPIPDNPFLNILDDQLSDSTEK